MKIVADEHIPFIHEFFAGAGELHLKPGRLLTASDVKQADMLLVRSITPVNEALLAGSAVKFVGSVTAGADHLDHEWLTQAGVTYRVAAGFNAPPVSDYVVSVVAALQQHQLLKQARPKAVVIGVGKVGSLVAKRLALLNMEVMLCDPLRAQAEAAFQSVPLDEIDEVDFISIHVPLTKAGEFATHHMIDASFLKRQKPGCVLLNAGRGAVIDGEALLAVGKHLHWCLDVWEREPFICKKILERAFIATPHMAGYSLQSKWRGTAMIHQLACEAGMMTPQSITSSLSVQRQSFNFSGETNTWQAVVLSVFNPEVVTALMRATLLSEAEYGPLFDEMRHQFNKRHEFSSTVVEGLTLSEYDTRILQGLNISDSR